MRIKYYLRKHSKSSNYFSEASASITMIFSKQHISKLFQNAISIRSWYNSVFEVFSGCIVALFSDSSYRLLRCNTGVAGNIANNQFNARQCFKHWINTIKSTKTPAHDMPHDACILVTISWFAFSWKFCQILQSINTSVYCYSVVCCFSSIFVV